ncbi:MAG TPA: 7TM diverse intracellular signaling domain-containing protein [Spirochaetota bacterium]|nr:7TM diverse intracellular signaling domain-containing protein [Spirochaetota bacterium]
MKKKLFVFFIIILIHKLTSQDFNFTDVDFSKKVIYELTGDWEFYYNQLLTPEDFTAKKEMKLMKVKVPSVWNGLKEKKLPGFGFGTYRTKIYVSEQVSDLGLKIVNISSGFKIWSNGILLYENGVVSDIKEKYKPSYKPVVINLGKNNSYEIVIQVANFSHLDGGIWDKVFFGDYQKLELVTKQNLIIEGFLFGCMIIMALYHFILFFIRKKDKYYLYFALTAFFAGIGIISRTETIIYQFYPDFNANFLKIIQYISYYMIGFFFALFINEIYIKAENKIFFRIFYIITLIFALLSLFLSIKTGFVLLLIHCCFLIAFLIYILINLIIMIVNKKPKATLFFAGLVVLLITLTHDVLYILHINNDGFWLIMGMTIYLFIQMIVISIDFINALNNEEILSLELKNNNEELKEILEEKTTYQKKLKSLNLKLINAERLERQKISQELHDSIVQLLGLSLIKIKKIIPQIKENEIFESITDIKDLIDKSSDISRNLIFELHPRILYELGLEAALKKVIDDLQKEKRISIILTYLINFDIVSDISFVIFSNVREFLINALKHSECKEISVIIKYEKGIIFVAVEDDGIGFDMEKYNSDINKHFGLFDASERIKNLSGTMNIGKSVTGGTSILFEIPYERVNL